MKANFWQILGIVLVTAGVVFVARKKMGSSDTVAPPAGNHAPAATTTAPTTNP